MSALLTDKRPEATLDARSEVVADAALADESSGGAERRGSGRRARARDRLMDRATRSYPPNAALLGVDDLETMLLFVDDDLRETGLAMCRIEDYLVRTLGLLEQPQLRRAEVQAIAGDQDVLEHLDQLNETVESLRRRLAKLAGRMRR